MSLIARASEMTSFSVAGASNQGGVGLLNPADAEIS
jgi:hypothetical protein